MQARRFAHLNKNTSGTKSLLKSKEKIHSFTGTPFLTNSWPLKRGSTAFPYISIYPL